MSSHTTHGAQRFFSVDAAWLRMDAPHNRVNIVGLALYDQPLAYDRLRAVVEDRLLRFPRFKQRVRESHLPWELPTWEPDLHFDLGAHVRRLVLPAPGDWATLQRVIEDLMRRPLSLRKPLWRILLVEKYGRGSAMIMCLSHAVADGTAMMHVLDTLMGETAEASLAPLAPMKDEPPPAGLADAIQDGIDWVKGTLSLPGQLLDQSLDAAADPVGTTLRGADVGLALGKLLFIPPDSATILGGRCGAAKRAVASEPILLAEVKAIAQAHGAKINDVILSAVAGGLRRYLLARGERVDGLNLRAIVPVYLTPWDDPTDLRNRFGLVFLPLPVGVADPVRRLQVLKGRMDEIKSTPEAAVAYGIMRGIGHTPRSVEHLITKVFGMKATAVMTNVAGPKTTRYLAGRPARRMMFWVPQPAGLGVGLSMISYAGELTVALATDAGLVPDPEAIIAGFEAEFRSLKRCPAESAANRRVPAQPRPAARASVQPARGENGTVGPLCQALTRRGQACQNHARPGSRFCARHARVLEAA